VIGTEMYTKILCDINLFLQSIATIPIGDFQHATLLNRSLQATYQH